MKRCSKCKQDLDESMFYRRGAGLRTECKRCYAAYQAAYRAANRERLATYNAGWRAANTAHIAARGAAYHSANRNRIAACHAAWRAANPEKEKTRAAAWRAANPDKRWANNSRRRARKLNQFIENVDRQELYRRYSGHCGVCGQPIDGNFHVDHIIPLSRGGAHGYENCQPTHPACNMSKGDRMPTEAICGILEIEGQNDEQEKLT